MKKYIILFGITIVLLFMIPAMTAFGTTASPPTAINNGNEFTLVSATPEGTIVHSNGIMDATNTCDFTYETVKVDSKTGTDLIKAEIADMTTAQFIDIDIASPAQMNTGTIAEGANAITEGNTASLNGTPMTVIANISQADGFTFVWNTADIRSRGADAHQCNSEVAFVLKIEISSSANVNLDHGSAESVRALSDNVDLYGITVGRLKMPINIDANNTDTDAVLTPTTISMVNTAINTSTAFGTTRTIEYSIPQAGQKVRTLVNENQAATYRMASAGVDATTAIDATTATEQIAMPALAMINSAANTYFTDITVTAMVQNQETAYANELAGVVSENTLLTAAWTAGNTGTKTTTTANSPKNTIDTDAMNRPATTLYAEQIATKIAGAGLVAPNFA